MWRLVAGLLPLCLALYPSPALAWFPRDRALQWGSWVSLGWLMIKWPILFIVRTAEVRFGVWCFLFQSCQQILRIWKTLWTSTIVYIVQCVERFVIWKGRTKNHRTWIATKNPAASSGSARRMEVTTITSIPFDRLWENPVPNLRPGGKDGRGCMVSQKSRVKIFEIGLADGGSHHNK